MSRILLLCFIHGFKGSDDTFRTFPTDLRRAVSLDLPDHHVEAVVYPKYETKGELAQSTAAFVEWLKERVMEIRKRHMEKPWPPHDREVGVILVAHSMGGFVAVDSLFRILDDGRLNEASAPLPIFPLIQGILAFDTPFDGLARSMFVYGAFSNYQRVSSVFNVMSALTAAAPATLSRIGIKRASASAARASAASSSSNTAWKTWQIVAVRTGTVGAIAAGGVAAYMNRKQIMEGVRSVRNLKKEDVVQGYRQSIDALGQGLAYINRGNVGRSFAWLSDHFTFVGALVKPKELSRRLERMAALKGVGIHDVYASLGENGYWSGGYFVPERTFCAIPSKDNPTTLLFERHVVSDVEDEVQAHLSLFKPDKNQTYEQMTEQAATLVAHWFNNDAEVFDDPKFWEPAAKELPEEDVEKAVESPDRVDDAEMPAETELAGGESELPDESPVDITAAASLVPLPDDDDIASPQGSERLTENNERQTYMRHLFRIAQQTGTGIKTWWPTSLSSVQMDQLSMPSASLPSVPKVSLPNISVPGAGLFSKKSTKTDAGNEKEAEDGIPNNAVEEPDLDRAVVTERTQDVAES